MKKSLLLLTLTIVLALNTLAQTSVTTVTVAMGASYANNKWYSFADGVKATQAANNWDLAFEINGGQSASILANNKFVTVFNSPYKIDDWAILDTNGMAANWAILHNSYSTWANGALNRTKVATNDYDLGWGVYNTATHQVEGDSIFVLKIGTAYKKLKINNLAGGVFSFTYSDLDGANELTRTITKNDYPNRNFAYFSFTSNSALDREPHENEWDILFTQYSDDYYGSCASTTPSGYNQTVTGVLHNKGVEAVRVTGVSNTLTFADWESQTFSTSINTIGDRWKCLNGFAWEVKNDYVYFVKAKNGNIYKIVFTGFVGTAAGEFKFTQQGVSMVSINNEADNEIAEFSIYPNPLDGNTLNFLFNGKIANKYNLEIIDVLGKSLYSETFSINEGLQKKAIDIPSLTQGVYYVKVNNGGKITTTKFIKN